MSYSLINHLKFEKLFIYQNCFEEKHMKQNAQMGKKTERERKSEPCNFMTF